MIIVEVVLNYYVVFVKYGKIMVIIEDCELGIEIIDLGD